VTPPPLQDKGVAAVSVIYERFMETPHFTHWFAQRRTAALTVPPLPPPFNLNAKILLLHALPSP